MRARQKRTHARRRALQRCGVNLSISEHDRIVREIQEGLPAVFRNDSRRSTYNAEIDGVKTLVVYDKQDQVLVTVKTLDMF